jgi:hypothetical protein
MSVLPRRRPQKGLSWNDFFVDDERPDSLLSGYNSRWYSPAADGIMDTDHDAFTVIHYAFETMRARQGEALNEWVYTH